MSEKGMLTDEQREMLDSLAELIIPEDDFDQGLKGSGFSGIIETKNIYQPWLADVYEIGLEGIQKISQTFFGKNFLDLGNDERGSVLDALASDEHVGIVWTENVTGPIFYTTLRQDACFVYSTDEDVWDRIGFPGSAFEKGGYPDFADPQE